MALKLNNLQSVRTSCYIKKITRLSEQNSCFNVIVLNVSVHSFAEAKDIFCHGYTQASKPMNRTFGSGQSS